MYLGEGIMKRDIWNRGGLFDAAGYLCREGDRVAVHDSPFQDYPLTIEPPGGRAFCCVPADVEMVEHAPAEVAP